MSLGAYRAAASAVSSDFSRMLADEEYEPFWELGAPELLRRLAVYDDEQRPLGIQLATAPPAKQKKILANLDLEQRFWTIALAARIAAEASALLEAADQWLREGSSYREMIGNAVQLSDAPLENDQYLWPFPFPPEPPAQPPSG